MMMGKHALTPAPTDVAERVKRTGLQVAIGAVVVLVVVLPEALRIAEEELGEHLPESFRAWMLGAAAVLTALSMALTRIMAIPAVNDFVSRWSPFGTAPPAQVKAIRAAASDSR